MIRTVTRTMLLVSSAVVTTALSIGGGTVTLAQGTLTIHDAWVRQPTGDRKEAAAFAVVENSGATTRAIVSVTAEVAEKAELHEMKMMGAMMQMSPVKQIKVPARGKVELKPGGYHVMLFGLKKMPMSGDMVALTFKFDDGSTVSATAPVRQDEGMKMNDSMPKK